MSSRWMLSACVIHACCTGPLKGQTTAPAATPPVPECTYGPWPCGTMCCAYVLGILGLPMDEGALRAAPSHPVDSGILEPLAQFLRAEGLEADSLILSPRRVRDLDDIAILCFRFPAGHGHFEVYLGAEDAHAVFVDITRIAGEVKFRAFESLGDAWDGHALVVRRKRTFFGKLTGLGGGYPLSGAVFIAAVGFGWTVTPHVRKKRRRATA